MDTRGTDENSLFRYFQKAPRFRLGMLSFVLVLLIGIIDYVTGPDLSVFIFYLIPVFFASWFLGKSGGITVSVMSALAWSLADIFSTRTYSYAIIPFWNLITEFAFFLVVVFILSSLKNALEQEQRMARMDFLTGAFNIRYFSELAKTEISRSGRYRHPFTLVYLDIDNFKTINDRFGHHAGDTVLILTVNTIRSSIRTSDLVARLGGDEFVLLFPETDSETAKTILEKLHIVLQERMRDAVWPVTFSVGAATFMQPPGSVDHMITLADGLMYEAKNAGKNRIRYAVIGKEAAG